MAGVVDLREVRYGYDGENHLAEARTNQPVTSRTAVQCIVCNRCVRACETQGTFALTISGKGLRLARVARPGPAVHGQRMRIVRRLRTGLSDLDAAGEVHHHARPGRALGHHHLRLLRRGLRLQGRDEGEGSGPHGAVEGRPGQPRTLVRQGRFAWGYTTHKERVLKP